MTLNCSCLAGNCVFRAFVQTITRLHEAFAEVDSLGISVRLPGACVAWL